MFVIRDAKTLLIFHATFAFVFTCLFIVNGNRAKMANALSQPLERVEIIKGQVINVRKEKTIAIILPTVKLYVDFTVPYDGHIQEQTFRCRGMSACYWLKPGPADIIVAGNGRYALPLELRDNFRVYRSRVNRNRNMSLIMAFVFSVMAGFSALSAGVIRMPSRLTYRHDSKL